jgi:TolA-binding protein
MRKTASFLLLNLLVSGATLTAQQSIVHSNTLSEYDNAIALYQEKQYLAAQILFDKVRQYVRNQEVQADCSYYIANCAIQLNQSDANTLMENFISSFPTSTKINHAILELATYYFESSNYPQAIQNYKMIFNV